MKNLIIAVIITAVGLFVFRPQTDVKKQAKDYLENGFSSNPLHSAIVIHEVHEIDSLFFNYTYIRNYGRYLLDLQKYTLDEMTRCYTAPSRDEQKMIARAVADTILAMMRDVSAAEALIPESFTGEGEKRKALKVSFSFTGTDPRNIILYYDKPGTGIWGDETSCMSIWNNCEEIRRRIMETYDAALEAM